jgi:hypothetical protein
MVAGKPDVTVVTEAEVRRRRLEPCSMCDAAAPAPPVT